MEVYKSINNIPLLPESVVTIGTFDGCHRGHQEVIKKVVSTSQSINKKSDQLLYSLKTQLAHNPYVGDIRGRGLFIGIEIVKNLETKKPFAPDLKIASSIKYAAFKAGLICYPMSGTRDGKWGDHILLAPPFIMNESQIIELVDKVSIALKVIKDAGLTAVCNFSIKRDDITRDGYTPGDACKILEDNGADVVGLNCFRGPKMTMKLLPEIRKKVSCHVAALPVPYRTTEKDPGFLNQTDEGCDCIPGGNAFPVALDNLYCNRFEMGKFAKECADKKINFIGICCGAEPHHVREMAVALGRKPISYKYYPDMSKHYAHGTDPTLKHLNTDVAKTL